MHTPIGSNTDAKREGARSTLLAQKGREAMSQVPGMAVTDLNGAIRVFDHQEKTGMRRNKGLVVPSLVSQVNPTIHCIEYISVDPGTELEEDRQQADTICMVHRGAGMLRCNGGEEPVESGSLVIAPCGARHALQNMSTIKTLDLLVIEMKTGHVSARPPVVLQLYPHLQKSDAFAGVRVGQRPVGATPRRSGPGTLLYRLVGIPERDRSAGRRAHRAIYESVRGKSLPAQWADDRHGWREAFRLAEWSQYVSAPPGATRDFQPLHPLLLLSCQFAGAGEGSNDAVALAPHNYLRTCLSARGHSSAVGTRG